MHWMHSQYWHHCLNGWWFIVVVLCFKCEKEKMLPQQNQVRVFSLLKSTCYVPTLDQQYSSFTWTRTINMGKADLETLKQQKKAKKLAQKEVSKGNNVQQLPPSPLQRSFKAIPNPRPLSKGRLGSFTVMTFNVSLVHSGCWWAYLNLLWHRSWDNVWWNESCSLILVKC